MRILSIATATLLSLFSTLALAGEFGDHCTTGLSGGRLVKTKCDINEAFEGKTYCFGSEEARAAFQKNPGEIIAKAAAFWAKNAEPEREKISQEQANAIIQSKNCDLSGKDVGYLDLKGMDLRHCTAVNTSFFGADLRGARLSGTNLQRAYLNLARLEGTDLTNADLRDAIIFAAIFDKTDFSGANLSNARIMGNLGNVKMVGANLTHGRLGMDFGNQTMGQVKFDTVGGNFANANFENADLQVASFRFADLSGANLKNAKLYRSDLIQANLEGANLSGADLTDAEVDGASFKQAQGLESIKGFATVKGKCADCAPPATAPTTTLAEAKPAIMPPGARDGQFVCITHRPKAE